MNLGLECFVTQDNKKKEDVFDSQQFMIDFVNHQHSGEVLNATLSKLVDIYNHICKFSITEENKALFASSFENVGLEYSFEGVLDGIRIVIAKIKEWIKKSIEYIKMFIAKLLPNNKEQIQAIQKRIKEIEQEYKDKRIEIKAGKFNYTTVNYKVMNKVESLVQSYDTKVSVFDNNVDVNRFKPDVDYLKEVIEDVRMHSLNNNDSETAFLITTQGTYPDAFYTVAVHAIEVSDRLVKIATTAKQKIEQIDKELTDTEQSIKRYEPGSDANTFFQNRFVIFKAKQTFLGLIMTFASEAQVTVMKNSKNMERLMKNIVEQHGK